MMNARLVPILLSLCSGLTLGACASEEEGAQPGNGGDEAPSAQGAADDASRIGAPTAAQATPPAPFHPPAREALPEGPFGASVARGRAIFMDPGANAAPYVGGSLACSNCHLDEGRRAGAAPLWAAWVRYPAYRGKNGHVNTMEERIQGCFTYSMNAQASPKGSAPPSGDPILTDLQAYAYWLATGAPTGKAMEGRGFPALDPPSEPASLARGAAVYQESCALCHGADGLGQRAGGEVVFPPLWGRESFNWGAGMHEIDKAAAFIRANMPLGQPGRLSAQQAWDVATFIDSQDRPGDPRARGEGVKAADAAFHDHTCSYGDEGPAGTLGRI